MRAHSVGVERTGGPAEDPSWGPADVAGDPGQAPRREIAHVLFMDVVGYARLSLDEQLARFRELQELVRRQPEFRGAEAGSDLLCLPTGDGMALVFFGDPVTPVQCAIGLAAAARGLPHLPLRIGL